MSSRDDHGGSEVVEQQIREAFEALGMAPWKIRYNECLDRYLVNIGVEGTDDQFLEGVGELGSDGSVDYRVDTTKLRMVASRVQGTQLPSGVMNVLDTMSDAHFLIEVVDE